jgi:hypothetical protein
MLEAGQSLCGPFGMLETHSISNGLRHTRCPDQIRDEASKFLHDYKRAKENIIVA